MLDDSVMCGLPLHVRLASDHIVNRRDTATSALRVPTPEGTGLPEAGLPGKLQPTALDGNSH